VNQIGGLAGLQGILVKEQAKIRNGNPALIACFCSPILEYTAPVGHFGLTAEQNSRLERVQKRALLILSKQAEMSYKELLTKFKMQTLKKRKRNSAQILEENL
jgi:hypothetical protein